MRRERKELLALRREVQRLRKELNRPPLPDPEHEYEEREEREEEASEPAAKTSRRPSKAEGQTCPRCKKQTEIVEFGPKSYIFCEDRTGCKWRRKR